jgi:hypothetical protein
MSSRARLLLAIALGVLVLILSSAGLAVAAVYHKGTIRMEIDEFGPGGNRYDLVLPASLVDLAIELVPSSAIEEATGEMSEILEHPACNLSWRSALTDLGDALESCPDAVFVEVRGKHERVLVEKRGRLLVVQVEDDDQRVHISVPVSTLSRAAEKLADSI